MTVCVQQMTCGVWCVEIEGRRGSLRQYGDFSCLGCLGSAVQSSPGTRGTRAASTSPAQVNPSGQPYSPCYSRQLLLSDIRTGRRRRSLNIPAHRVWEVVGEWAGDAGRSARILTHLDALVVQRRSDTRPGLEPDAATPQAQHNTRMKETRHTRI